MLYVITFIAFTISFGIVLYLTPKLLLLSLKKKMIDRIDNRKMHTSTASRFGGFSFFPAIFLSLCLCVSLMCFYDKKILPGHDLFKVLLLSCALFILYMLGIVDDIASVRYRKKFLFQILAAGLVVLSGIWVKDLHGFCGIGKIPDAVGITLTIFLLVFITNSINLIDGIDGLASLLAIIALLAYGTIFLARSVLMGSLFAFASLGTLIPFFYFNVFGIKKKAGSKIFMGDAGSQVIGFLLGVMAVSLWNMDTAAKSASYPSVLAYTMLIVPCSDAIRVVMYRSIKRRPLFLADNNHIHHKLLQRGLTPRQTLFTLVIAALTLLLLNICLTGVLNITSIAVIDILTVVLFFHIVNRKSRFNTRI